MLLKRENFGAVLCAVATLSFVGCASKPQAVSTTQNTRMLTVPDYYTVRPGDTLSNIASRYGLDYLTVAQMNNIQAPYIVYVSQNLKLKSAVPNVPSVAVTTPPSVPPIQKQSIPLPAPVKTTPPVVTQPTVATNILTWVKPSNNVITENYNLANNVKGMRYGGQVGDSVMAAADGQVVYADSGLKEFGNLILIKHSNGYISAYAHNSKLLVQSGTRVSAGQKIAEMGTMLEFQVRANGKAINPAQVIPMN